MAWDLHYWPYLRSNFLSPVIPLTKGRVCEPLTISLLLASTSFLAKRPWVSCIPWWRHQMETFPRYWPFVRVIHRSPVNSPQKGQWRGALMVSLICAFNKRLSIQSWGWGLETPSRSLWRHCNEIFTGVWTSMFIPAYPPRPHHLCRIYNQLFNWNCDFCIDIWCSVANLPSSLSCYW